jgi:membrane protein
VGAEVAYFHQHPSAFIREALPGGKGHRSQEWLALSALVEITQRHLSEAPPWQPTELATYLGVSSLENLFDEFVRAGVLLRSAEPEGIALARPPESVAVKDILDIVADAATPAVENGGPAAHVLLRRDQAAQKALEGLTLRSLVSETPSTIVKFPHASATQSR